MKISKAMRITLTLSQLIKILQTEPIKFPIRFKGADFTPDELKMFQKILQQAERRG